jgi:hypothetical protein
MPQLKVPSADLALKLLVGPFIITTLDCQIIVSQALGFTRNRGLDFSRGNPRFERLVMAK